MLFKNEYNNFDKTLDVEWPTGSEGESYFKSRITNNDGCAFVARVDDKIVGYLVGGISKQASHRIVPKFADMENMYVLEEYRSKGVGQMLYGSFLKWCKENGVGRIKAVASFTNTRAIEFYRKNGFQDFELILEQDI